MREADVERFLPMNLSFVGVTSCGNILLIFSPPLSSTTPQGSRMAWCTCPVRCKGGREVAERTRTKHEKELRDQERQRLDQIFSPTALFHHQPLSRGDAAAMMIVLRASGVRGPVETTDDKAKRRHNQHR